MENDLAQKLGASRHWIRDALKILETRGLVKMVPYKGAMVSDLTEKEINEVFQVRVVLERLSYRLACDNYKKTDGRRLRKLADRLQFDDPINIQFTRGTTGAPKGATLTHHNILNNGFFVGQTMQLTERDRVCIPVPLYHCFGMVLGNLACITHGAAMVFPG